MIRPGRGPVLVQRLHEGCVYLLAYVWRRLLLRTTVIAVTGSVGKTTAKECTAAVFASAARTAKTRYNQNDRYGVPRTILRLRPWHRFAVVEVATDRPGVMRRSAALVRPDVAVVLTIARTHTKYFSSLEASAAEKSHLLAAVPRRGLAILNADDPHVAAMATRCRCRVTTFGRSPRADVRADGIASAWPSRLTFRAHTSTETRTMTTRLVGEHWVTSVLAALAAGVSCGISLRQAAEAVARVEPFNGRMQPVRLPGGATVIRDEYNASPATLEAALAAFETFRGQRRILVTSGVSDSPKNSRARFRELGERAARAADVAVFVNKEHAHHATKAAIASGMRPDRVHGFADLQAAAEYLKQELRSDDLVLLKGRTTDHLSRIFFAQLGTIGCWKERCRKTIVCDFCEELRGPRA